MKKSPTSILLQVAELGDPHLRMKASPVTNIETLEIQSLIKNLIATCEEVDGVGIAAPQVYQSLQLCIIASKPSPRYPKAPFLKPFAVINPKIVSKSKTMKKDWEGCLSIPGIRGLVPRHTWIVAEYTTADGKKKKQKFTDFVARVFQHEYDHLQGVMFLDRAKSTELVTNKECQKIMKKKSRK